MNTVGVFAGRGDVILAMGMSLLFGIWLGWQAKRLQLKLAQFRANHISKE